jgi:hypothetical protein
VWEFQKPKKTAEEKRALGTKGIANLRELLNK